MSRRILVLDDDRGVCATLEFVLNQIGYTVRSVQNWSDARAVAQNGQFDLLISDLVMPEMDGTEVIRRFKKSFPATRIVAMSGGARIGTPDTLAIAREAGADSLLSKPFTRASLIVAIETAYAKDGVCRPDISDF